MLDKFVADRIADVGPPQRCTPLRVDQDERLSKVLPDSFMEFLRLYGLGDYFSRRLQYCYPADFSSILALVFGADPDFSHKDCYIVAYSAFGRLICWSERHDSFEIDLVDLRLTSRKLAPTQFILPRCPEARAQHRPKCADTADVAVREQDLRGVRLSRPTDVRPLCCCPWAARASECYGYFPAISTVGLDRPIRRLESIKRVKALEHFAILAQLGTFHLMKLERGAYVSVRPIG